MKQRFALVGKTPGSFVIELAMEGGMMAMAGKITMRVELDSDLSKAERIKKMIMQIGNNDPMEMPAAGANFPQGQFGKVDPQKLVDKQEITVPAGTFKTSHYRDKTSGNTFDYWINEDVPPFGLVKLQGTIKPGPQGMPGGEISMVLAARGGGAKPIITKAAKPFDPAAMMGQMSGGHGAGGPSSAPPAAPPTAAPKKK